MQVIPAAGAAARRVQADKINHAAVRGFGTAPYLRLTCCGPVVAAGLTCHKFLLIVQKLIPLFVAFLLFATAAAAQQVREPGFTQPSWLKPIEPFRIAGNLYYVGTEELASYLLTTPEGNVLVNTGTAASAPLIRRSIEQLGFRLNDVKILLTTQVHYDHVGAMADIRRLTGARLMVDAADADVMEDGGNSDYEYGGHGWLFRPATVDLRLHDGDTISLGGTQLVMLHHPGHTKGSCSFMVTVTDEQRPYRVLIANMPTIITERHLNAMPEYPQIAADYAGTLQSMKTLQFDLWVASHASQFDLARKRKSRAAYNPEAFAGRKDYDAALDELEQGYARKLKQTADVLTR